MPDYTKSKIYKITSIHTDKIYIGSTTKSLKHRYNVHNCKINSCTSKILFELGECNIVSILDYPCNNKHELDLIESYYIQKNNCVNQMFNRGGNKERKREYYKKNKDKYKEYSAKNKEYYEKNKDKKKEYISKHKDRQKEYMDKYYKKNKEYAKQYNHFRQSIFGQLCKLYNI